jgi:hypothetical protein
MVNMINRRAAITQAPYPARLNGVLPAAPRDLVRRSSTPAMGGLYWEIHCPKECIKAS